MFCERSVIVGEIVIDKNGDDSQERSRVLTELEQESYGKGRVALLQLAVNPGVIENRASRPSQ